MKQQRQARVVKHPTVRDVAELAGTSIATVSYVLNDSKERYIANETRKKVLAAAKELNYVKSAIASSLKGKKRGIIAVLTPQFENPFFVSIFTYIEKTVNENSFVLSICNTFDEPKRELEILERMAALRVDGYLIIPTHEGTKNTTYIREHGLPFVAIERPLDGISDYDFISSDNFSAAYKLTQHIIDCGHRKIALVYWDTPISNLGERYEGFKKACMDNGLPYEENLVKIANILTHEEGARLTKDILSDNSITAVIFGQYILAEGGIKFLKSQNVKIPDRLSVAIFGRPKWIEMNEICYTCVSQPGKEMGKLAAEILFSKLQLTQQPSDYIQTKLDCTLHIGESVKLIRR